MKDYRQKNFQLYRCNASSMADWTIMHDFKNKFFKKFMGISEYDFYVKYGMGSFSDDANQKYMQYNNFFYIAKAEGDIWIIHNDEKEMVKYFEENAPMQFFKKYKRINHLDAYLSHRDRFNDDFDNQIKHFEKLKTNFFKDSEKEEEYLKTLDGYREHLIKQRKKRYIIL